MRAIANIFGWSKRQTKLLAGIGAGLVVGGVSSAAVLASIPDGNGVIHGCIRNNGDLRIIDSATQTCSGAQTPLNFNQTGPQGPQGPVGPQGLTGAAFVSSLVGANFDGVDFRYRELRDLDLHDSNFSNARLEHVDFESSNVRGVIFLRAKMAGVNLHNQDLTGAQFGQNGNTLNDSDLSESDFTDATFMGGGQFLMANTNFSEAVFTRTVFVPNSNTVRFNDSNLTNASFTDTTLLAVDLTSANLAGVTWTNVVCPDGTNSNDNGNTCLGHLVP